jgi:hypothetical protein
VALLVVEAVVVAELPVVAATGAENVSVVVPVA